MVAVITSSGAGPLGASRSHLTRLCVAAAVLVVALCGHVAFAHAAGLRSAARQAPAGAACPDAYDATFGPNVCVFNSSMSQSAIQSDLDAIADQQVPISSQFDSQRYAIFFEPGTYGSASDPLVFQVGYYTEVAGLGANPQDTVIDGAIDVFNNLCTLGTSDCNSDDNFWRSLSNVTLNVDLPTSPPNYAPAVVDAYGAGCTNSAEIWSASQADPIRRTIINGSVVFQDYCSTNNYASGGFIADSQVNGDLDFYGNEQYMVRNSQIGGAAGCPDGLWNMVYSGVEGAPSPTFSGQCEQNTVLAASPASEEEPFLFADGQGAQEVFVPAVQTDSTGPSWAGGNEAGTSIPLSRFFIANPSTPASRINLASARGQDVLLTPGVYDLDQPIVIHHHGVVLGLGFATLVPQTGKSALIVQPNAGVKVSGLIIDAGPVNSKVLMAVGAPHGGGSSSDPDLISDVFFRVGGAETTPVSANLSLLDNASNSIIDDVWAWRADHGNDIGWTENQGDTGLQVTGNDVTAYGLAVEHYQRKEVIWSGQGGTTIFFQNELPYDVPSQSSWMESPTHDGYPAFAVSKRVTSFQGYGLGSYVTFVDTPATLDEADAFDVPDASGVQLHDVFGVWIAGSGGDSSLIDQDGVAVTSTDPGNSSPVDVTSYP
jgi:hypothetical protein